MLNILKSYSANMSMKRRISLIVLINITALSIIALVGISVVIRVSNKLLYQSMSNSLSYSATDISKELETIQTMSNMLVSDDMLQQYLSTIKDADDYIARKNAFDGLYTTIQSYYNQFKQNNVSFISLYNDKFATNTYSIIKQPLPDKMRDDIIEKALEKDGATVWITDYGNEYGLFIAREVRRIKNLKLDTIGVVVICIDTDRLIQSSTNYSGQNDKSSYLLFDKEKLIYHSTGLQEDDVQEIQTHLYNSNNIVKLDHSRYFGIRGTIPKYNWDYIYLVSYDNIYHTIMFIRIIFLLIVISGVFLTAFLSNILIKSLTKHFDNLITKMKAFGEKNTEIIDVGYDYSNRSDELGLLHIQFDNMALQIRHLIEVNYINELLMKDAQLKALEAQINPHFLYNTLESVNWRAKAINERKISLMIESLGNLLRITLSRKNQKNFTLKKELELVYCYMTIQQIRFEEQLHYHLNAEDNLLDTYMPKLIIQPLVENAIQYALEEIAEKCYINIDVVRNEDKLDIYVKNNGSQFEEDLLTKLEDDQALTHGFGIGLLNIDHRLKLTFGEEYGLSLYNEDEMAVAKITIPFNPGESKK